ncbi:hypothetical protein DFH06DRAFT_2664 [Mycena polygramma]|nr:hypothetical protein DFH06DRAFT_2664 [Mycena polygramma]
MSRRRAVDTSRSLNISSPVLILQLNQLLTSLEIPITVESHVQLSPALFICILESLLETRLPISQEHRDALFSSNRARANTATIHCMKIFLGVLQSDILQQDVGISRLDPRALAHTEDEETIYIARLLCWYGRRKKLITRPGAAGDGRRAGSAADPRNESGSPSTALTRVGSSPLYTGHRPESDTSVSPATSSPLGAPSPMLVGPRCIHELPSPSLVLSPASHMDDIDLDSSVFAREARPGNDVESGLFSRLQNSNNMDSSVFAREARPGNDVESQLQNSNTSVRYEGYIEVVDQALEIAAFEAHRDADQRRRDKGKGREVVNDAHAPDDGDILPSSPPRRGKARQMDPNEGSGSGSHPVQGAAAALATEQERRLVLLRRKAGMLDKLAGLYEKMRVSQ